MGRVISRAFLVLLAMFAGSPAGAEELLEIPGPKLLGGAVAARGDSAAAAMFNPALAGTLRDSQVEGGVGVFSSTKTSIELAGAAPKVKAQAGPDLLSGYGGIVLKLSPRFGVGLLALPPGLSAKIDTDHVPVNILGQVYDIDLAATVTTGAVVQVSAGYRVTPRLALGIKASAMSFEGTGSGVTSEGGLPLASFSMQMARQTFGGGALLNLGPRLEVGLVLGLGEQYQYTQRVRLDLLPVNFGDLGTIKNQGARTLPDATLGLKIRPRANMQLLADLKWMRADTSRTQFSLVDRREKPLDSYDVVAVRAGVQLSVSQDKALVIGARYEPAAIGKGGRGEGSKSGYGLLQTAPVMLGMDLTPYWAVSGGLEIGVGRIAVTGGLVFQSGSLGIAAEGEQPGSYRQTKFSAPVGVKLKF